MLRVDIRADFQRRAFCLFVNGEAIGNVFYRFKLASLTREWLLSEIHLKTYPDEITNTGPEWLGFCADLESGRDELEPHQVVSRDFVSGVADEHREAA